MYANCWEHYVVCSCNKCCNCNYHHYNSTMSSYPYNYCPQFEESPSSSTNCGFGRSYTKLTVNKPKDTINDIPTVSAKSSTKLKKKSSKATKKTTNSSGGKSSATDRKYNENLLHVDQVTRKNIATLNGSKNNVRLPHYDTVQNMESSNDNAANKCNGSKTCHCCNCKNNPSGSNMDFITKNGLPFSSDNNKYDQDSRRDYPIKYNTKSKTQDRNRASPKHATKSNINFLEQEHSNENFYKLHRQPSHESHDFHNKLAYESRKTNIQNSHHSSYCCIIPAHNSKCSLTKSESYIRNHKYLPKCSNKCNCCNCQLKSPKQFVNPISQSEQSFKFQQIPPVVKHKTISTKINPQLDVINEEIEADDIANYNYPQKAQTFSKPTNNSSGPFENFKDSIHQNEPHKSLEDSCADFLNIICDSILESVEKSLDTKLRDYCNKQMEKIEGLSFKLENHERKMEKLHCDLMEKMSIQNENYQRQFSLLLKFLVESHAAKETLDTTHEDKESQCNIEIKVYEKNTEIDPMKGIAIKSDVTNNSETQKCCDYQSKISIPTVSSHILHTNNATKVLPTPSNPNNGASEIKNPPTSNFGSAACMRSSQGHHFSRDFECYCSDDDECVKEKIYFEKNYFSHLTTFTTTLPQNQPALNISTESATVIICHTCRGTPKTCICQTEDREERDDIYTDDENWETSGYATEPEDNGENVECFGRKKIQKKSKKKQATNNTTATLGTGRNKGNLVSGTNQNHTVNNMKRSKKSRSPTRLSRL